MSSSRSEGLSEAGKVRAFEALVQAWDHLEEAWMLQAQRLWEPAREALGQSLRVAGQSLAILDSASPEAIPQLGLLRHLINTDRHFRSCSWTELEAIWNRDSSAASDPDRANRVVRTFLEAAESYHFSHIHRHHQLRRNLLFTALGSIYLVLAGLYVLYSYLEPTRAYVTHGQLFWRTSAQESEEVEANSTRFPVKGDGAFHEYTLPLEVPVTMFLLRLDAVMEASAEVWIERIEVYRRGQTSPLVLRFDQSDHAWIAARDMASVTVEDGTLHFRTPRNDPILLFPRLNQDRVEAVKVRMRTWLRPNFLRWLYPTSTPSG